MTDSKARVIGTIPLAALCIAFVAIPLGLMLFGGLTSAPQPGGFGQNAETLWRLSSESLVDSLGSSLIATLIALSASVQAFQSAAFDAFYRKWLVTAVFVNPVFLVLGFSSISASWNAQTAVVLATAYVVLPLGGLIIQAAVDEFPLREVRAARTLGASMCAVLSRHVLPSISGQVSVGLLLMTAYAFGFYLLPTFVGLGRIRTLAVSIDVLTNQVGNWHAAQQVACILLALETVLFLSWLLVLNLLRRTARR